MSNLPGPDDQFKPASGSPPVSGEDLLPPVEPPSAGFILQLFIVPALIVMVVVGVWLTFTWLVHRSQPKDLIQGLESTSVARWQRASELADMLRNERYEHFKSDQATAMQLAGILDREIDSSGEKGGMDEESVTLRYFLCRALGEFQVPDVLDVLLKAAKSNRDPREQMMRQGAIEAIAVLTFNLRESNPPRELSGPEFNAAFQNLATDEDEAIRSTTAYTLGRIGTPESLELLETLVDDPHADTRFNAAVALAHHGRESAAETLAEMLDYTEPLGVKAGDDPRDQIAKRTLVLSNAMEAAQELSRQNPNADLSAVNSALEALAAADEAELQKTMMNPRRARTAAEHTLRELQQSE
jgi:hypothetical protein